ncbi:hypothetical protein PsAD46_05413 [Pseudovibrio sp. Ad46]|uniref:hypothetical protein n=1 Tax=Pseudovibrio sp. Ad46 TaxID=989432 RepID=UPI0007AECC08|nr:hypothetical protein [Pseudovibrio sp. Ad46]KZK76156.1 hypothetical protein PsAD46_05413 [Pseudovibrio sp. Ad46]
MAGKYSKHDATGRTTPKTLRNKGPKNKPPEGDWIWVTGELLESETYRSLSINARKVLDRLKIEHIAHGGKENGKRKVTHLQFAEYGVGRNRIADAIDELAYVGLIAVNRGRAGKGTGHPNEFRLTWIGDWEGNPATNEWKGKTATDAKRWTMKVRGLKKSKRQAANENRTRKNPHSPKLGCLTPQSGGERDAA